MKKIHFLFIATILARLLDVISTAWGTPTLERELNPFVSILHFNWTGVIILNLIVCIVFIIIIYLYNEKYLSHLKKTGQLPVNSFKEYVSYTYYGTPNKFNAIFYSTPKNKKAFLYHLFYPVAISHIFYSIILFINNISITFFYNQYHNLCKIIKINLPRYLIFFGLIIYLISIYFVIKNEYKEQRIK